MTIERLTRFKIYVLACSESEQEMAIKEVGYSEEYALVWHNAVPDSSLERGKYFIYRIAQSMGYADEFTT